MMIGDRSQLIGRYRQGHSQLAEAVAGLSEAELDATPPDGGWSAREIVHHTADSELTAAIRLRRLIAEDEPVIQGYDEELFARRLHYRERPIGPSLEAVRVARESCFALLDLLSGEEWARSGTHSDSGPYSVETWLGLYADHCHDHAAQIRRATGRASSA